MNNKYLYVLMAAYAIVSVLLVVTIISEARTIIGHNIESDKVYAIVGFRDMNRTVWQEKLDYAAEYASSMLNNTHKVSVLEMNHSNNTMFNNPYGTYSYKLSELNTTYAYALRMSNSSATIAIAKILEAKQLALLNGESEVDTAGIEAEALNKSNALNQTTQLQILELQNIYNTSKAQLINTTIITGINYTIEVKDGISGSKVLLTYKYGLLTGVTRP